jgi:protoporphyrin/coproporphyrin ferrochelatase
MKTAVLLINFGGPRTLEEVPLFLKRMMGREAPTPVLEALLQRYEAIGGGSPLAEITEEQARLLSEQTGDRFLIASAFRFSNPTIEEMIDQYCNSGVERIVFFIMSPFYTSKTAGTAIRTAQEHIEQFDSPPQAVFVHSWYGEPLFLEAWKAKILEEAAGEEAFYLFTAHSLPQSLSEEPYAGQIDETVRSLAQGLGLGDNHALGWQSVPARVNEPWIGPSVESLIDMLWGRTKRLIEIPVGFVSDHLETLYDMDIAHRNYAEARGFQFSRISSLNIYPPYIAALKSILMKSLEEDQ